MKNKAFGILSCICDSDEFVGLTSFNNSVFLMDPHSNKLIWQSKVGSHGLHEILFSSPYLLLNERFSNAIHIFDSRNLSSPLHSVERASQSQQVQFRI